jgi:signal transduction histidine kinase
VTAQQLEEPAAQRIVLQDKVFFTSDGQLLAELGERLIAKPTIAVSELIKNAYDADATEVYVWISKRGKDRFLNVQDNGTGMTKDRFLSFWMRIGTAAKASTTESPRFHRPITGAKGVGRFAARLLGGHLTLTTVAKDPSEREYRKLVAEFRWSEFKSGKDLQSFPISYTVFSGIPGTERGTHLTIGELNPVLNDAELESVTRDVLQIVNPPVPAGSVVELEKGKADPGLSLFFGEPGSGERLTSAVVELFDRFVAKATIRCLDRRIQYEIEYRDIVSGRIRARRNWTVQLPDSRSWIGRLAADIRYYPRRPGLFHGMETMDGREAYSYLQAKGGVRVLDRGFRLLPYGEPDDDWLQLSASVAQHARKWMSPLIQRMFPEITDLPEGTPNPFLHLPTNRQLLGTVSVDSHHASLGDSQETRANSLQPAMDRQGFVTNTGFAQLLQIVRTAVEAIAVFDVEQLAETRAEAAKKSLAEARRDIGVAIKRVQSNESVPRVEREALVADYQAILDHVGRVERLGEQTVEAFHSISLLGVLAGFLTHESEVMFRSVREAIEEFRNVPVARRTPGVQKAIEVCEGALRRTESYMDYARLFLGGITDADVARFRVLPQIELVVNTFKEYTDERAIKPELHVPRDLMSPRLPPAVYSGILLNLYTNAIKSVVRTEGTHVIRIDAANDGKVHLIQVSDTGGGVPAEIQPFLFKPFVSTTRGLPEGPTGSGLGLGLYIVKRVLDSVGGRIRLADPLEGYNATFEVRLPSE